jgi:hypothetical protein
MADDAAETIKQNKTTGNLGMAMPPGNEIGYF